MRTIAGQRLTKLAVKTVRNSGQFKKGNKKGKGGQKPGAGRPTIKQEQAKAQVLEELRLNAPKDLEKLNELVESKDSTPELKAKILMWKMNKVVPDLKQLEGGDIIVVEIHTNMPGFVGTPLSHAKSTN